MSALAYGRIVRRRGTLAPEALADADAASGQDDNKLITALAGVVPVEVVAAHGIIIAAATTTDDSGVTMIKEGASDPLKLSLIGLVALAVILYLFGRGLNFRTWTPIDVVRLLLPPVAFVIWTALIGTSALTPWIQQLGDISHLWVTIAAAIVGAVVVAISVLVAPPKAD
jgi:hypothetical protein